MDLSDDDVPTMSGTPGSDEDADDSGDTTSADLSIPVAGIVHAAEQAEQTRSADASAAEPEGEEPAGHDADDRTVQQQVSSRSSPDLSGALAGAPATASPSTLASEEVIAGKAAPPTQVFEAAIPTHPSPGVAPAPPAAKAADDDDELEDSVTATAPRLSPAKLALAMPGAVEIRTVEHDELLDETEVKTLANLPPELEEAIKSARTIDPRAPQRSQPPPPPRPAAGQPAVPVSAQMSTQPSRGNDRMKTAVSPSAPPPPPPRARPAAVVEARELDSEELSPDSDEMLPADEEGDTTQALAPRLDSIPDGDVTSKTLEPPRAAVASRPAKAEEVDEPATRPGLGGEGAAAKADDADASATDDPPTRPGLEAPTRPGLGGPAIGRPSEAAKAARKVEPREEESELDDSITTLAPKVSPSVVASVAKSKPLSKPIDVPNEDDQTDGTTKVKRVKADDPLPSAPKPSEPTSPADEEGESITTQAPGPLTNMLRVIAADRPSGTDDEPLEEQEPEENRTAVMANAPLMRAAEQHLANGPRSNGLSAQTQMGIGPRAVAAPQLTPTSESGLRVARGSASGEHASLGHVPALDPRTSGVARSAMPGDPHGAPVGLAHANTELAFPPSSAPQPSVHDVELGRGPRYGLLVGIVAVVSFVVPVTLFFVLRGTDPEPRSGTPNEAATDFQKHEGPRTKLERGKKPPVEPSASVSASASAVPSASSSAKPPPGRFGVGGPRR